MQQAYMSTRGLTSANNIVQIDGLMINGLDGDGAVQQYINNQMIQEMSYTTAGAGADVSPGGVRVNVVMKDGGNQHSGSFFGAWNDGGWQSDNHSDALLAAGSAPSTRSRRSTSSAAVWRPHQARQAVVLRRRPPERRARADRRHLLRAAGATQADARPAASPASRASTISTSTAPRCA